MRRLTLVILSLALTGCTIKPNDALIKAASQCDIAEMEAALTRGADIHFMDKKGNDALTISTIRGKPECVRILLKHGAKIRFTKSVLSAPEIAASMGHDEVLSVFFESGFSPNWRDPSGRTLLHAAAEGQEKKPCNSSLTRVHQLTGISTMETPRYFSQLE
jgi:ankyrin repeat protein